MTLINAICFWWGQFRPVPAPSQQVELLVRIACPPSDL